LIPKLKKSCKSREAAAGGAAPGALYGANEAKEVEEAKEIEERARLWVPEVAVRELGPKVPGVGFRPGFWVCVRMRVFVAIRNWVGLFFL
jgi:hypothetical protein